MEQRERKNVVMGMLLAAICIMAVGYAALAQQLTINGTAQITSTWDIKITGISVEGTPSPSVTSNTGFPKFTNTTAEFDVNLINPGDTITYKITVSNAGSLKAKLSEITSVATNASDGEAQLAGNDAIQYEVYGTDAVAGAKLPAKNGEANGTNTIYVKVTYNPDVTTQPVAEQLSKKIVVTLNYVQDLS